MFKSRIILWSIGGFFVVIAGGYLAVRLWFSAYLHSDGFRRMISQKTSAALKADGGFDPFQFTGATIYSDGFRARGEGAFFSTLRADQIRAEFNLGGVWHRAWQVDRIDVQRLEMKVGDGRSQMADGGSGRAENGAPASMSHLPSPSPGWLPNRLDLRKLVVQEGSLQWGTGLVAGTTVTLTPDGDAQSFVLEGGRLIQLGWPELKIDSARLRYRRPTLFITSAELKSGQTGSVAVSGEIDFEREAGLQLKLNGVPVTPLLPVDWRARLKGNLAGDVKLRAPLPATGALRVEGSLRLTQGGLEALPVLDQIATFTRTPQFKTLNLSRASGDFAHDGTKTVVTKFVLESEGLIRMEGSFTVADANIDGAFQVGVTELEPAMASGLAGEGVHGRARGLSLGTDAAERAGEPSDRRLESAPDRGGARGGHRRRAGHHRENDEGSVRHRAPVVAVGRCKRQ